MGDSLITVTTPSDFCAVIPAWRFAKFRRGLREVAHRARNPNDPGDDIIHRAARRVFARERAKATAHPPLRGGTKRTFSNDLQAIMFSCIIPGRLAGRSTKDIHQEIVKRCAPVDERAPVVGTVASWYWRLCPPAIQSRLGLEDPSLPVGDLPHIASDLRRALAAAGLPLDEPTIVDSFSRHHADSHRWRSIAVRDPGLDLWWILSPSWERSYDSPPSLKHDGLWYLHWSSSTSPTCDYDFRRQRRTYYDAIKHLPSARTSTLSADFLRYRAIAVEHIIPPGFLDDDTILHPPRSSVTLSLPGALPQRLEDLAKSGLYGTSAEDVALFLLRLGIAFLEHRPLGSAPSAAGGAMHPRPAEP